MEVSGKDAALSRTRRHHEEVECFGLIAVLDKPTIDDTARRRVDELTTALILDEEALGDALVYDNKADLRRLSSFIVQLTEGLTELFDLLSDDLLTLGITDTITVDDQMGREHAVVVLGKDLNRLLQTFFHLSLDDFLALRLHNVLRVVLTHLFVSTGGKADD